MSSFTEAIDVSNESPLHIVIIGFGVVGKGVLVGLQKHFRNVRGVVLDMSAKVVEDGPKVLEIPEFTNATNTWEFKEQVVNSSNYVEVFTSLTAVGTIVVETCVEVNTANALSWCLRNGRHFTNTVCDMWREETYAKTDHYRNIHGILRDYVLPVAKVIRDVFLPEKAANTVFPTALIGNGANIGMVNHYFKKAMNDASAAWGVTVDEIGPQLKGVYIFEKDTIVFKKDFVPQPNIFYNTWNVLEFHLESVAHVDYPPTTTETDDLSNGVLNVFYDRAMNRDLTLNDVIVHGRVVSHEETYSIADYCYRRWGNHPEVQFLYECSPIGEVCRVKYPLGSGCVPVCVSTEADPDVGSDLVGTLIILKDGRAWSTYFDCAQVDISAELKEFTNSTAWYVSCGVLSSILFLREFPQEGPGFPEDFDCKFNDVVARNFERFVTSTGKEIRSQDESPRIRLTGPFPTYECENHY